MAGIIAIGASSGGVEALNKILINLPNHLPPIVIVIHLQPGIAKLFAARLNEISGLHCKQADNGDVLKNGHIYVAPAGKHMKVVKKGIKHVISLEPGAPVNACIPSVDILFKSVAAEYGRRAVGAILTGIGADGASGLKAMRDAGAATVGQDEGTSTVYGMPKVAYEIGAVQHQLPLSGIKDKILSLLKVGGF